MRFPTIQRDAFRSNVRHLLQDARTMRAVYGPLSSIFRKRKAYTLEQFAHRNIP